MDIKEISLKHSREYLTFKLGGRKGLDVAEIVCDDEIYAEIVDELAQQFESIIESYKAELLNEAGEPVAVTNQAQLGYVTDGMHHDIPLAMWAKETSYSGANIALYTSDQVAAAIIKATKPLEERIKWLQDKDNLPVRYYQPNGKGTEYAVYGSSSINFVEKLRTQLAAAQEASAHWQRATAENENKWIEANDKLAKAEQRVAEACALQVATETRFHWLDAARVAKEIRSGEWRKFVKEV